MQKRIAIIGANESISPLIEKVKAMNYETHVFALPQDAIGEKIAHCFYPIDVIEKDAILAKCRELDVCAVCSITSDVVVPTVNYVAQSLGLTCNPESTSVLARDKYQMRSAFQKAGLYTPDFYKVDKSFLLSDLPKLAYPVIVKPIDSWSSKGITRVDTPNQLKDAVAYAIQESLGQEAIIEEFIYGQEYSAECICYQGEYSILALTKKHTTDSPHYIEIKHTQPVAISKKEQSQIQKTICKALKALNIQNGAAHAEFRIMDNGEIALMEVGARMAGDCIGTDLTCISTGMDYIKMVVDVACGQRPKFDIITEPKPVSIHFIMNAIDLEDFNEIQKHKKDLLYRYRIFDTDFGKSILNGSTRHGYYILLAE